MKKIVLVALVLFGFAAANMSADPYMSFVDDETRVIWNQCDSEDLDSVRLNMLEKYDEYAKNLKKVAKEDGKKYEPDVVFYWGRVGDGINIVATANCATCKKDKKQWVVLWSQNAEEPIEALAWDMRDDMHIWDMANTMVNANFSYGFPAMTMRVKDNTVVWLDLWKETRAAKSKDF